MIFGQNFAINYINLGVDCKLFNIQSRYIEPLSSLGVVQEIAVSKIRHATSQFRMKLDSLDDLAESIRIHGLLQPIVVRPMPHFYEVIAGNRRFAATKLLGLRKISCHLVDLSDREAYEVALVENLQHKTMNPMEEAMAFSQYVTSHGWGGVTDLSKRIGRSQEFVSRRIQLLKLPTKIQDEIMRGRISPSVALEMLSLDKDAIEGFADFVIGNPLTRNEIRRIVRVSKTKTDEEDSVLLSEDQCSRTEIKMAHEKEHYLLDRALRKSIAVMKSTLLNFDDIVNNVHDDWILKELLMQYRLIIHGDIDTFMKLRKRLILRIPKGYIGIPMYEVSQINPIEKTDADSESNKDSSIHVWSPKGIWQ
jgi:ParB family transcriptional regulator, chromosome partitioning protein